MTETVNKGGRPSKYKPEFCEQMIEFFSVNPTEMRMESEVTENIKIGEKELPAEKTKSTKKGGGVDFPSFTRFAHTIGVCDDTLTEWASVHPEFSVATKWCKKLQEDIWLVNGLNGNYSAPFSIFLGKNVFGYKDKQEIENTHNINLMPSVKLGGKEVAFNTGEAVLLEDKEGKE